MAARLGLSKEEKSPSSSLVRPFRGQGFFFQKVGRCVCRIPPHPLQRPLLPLESDGRKEGWQGATRGQGALPFRVSRSRLHGPWTYFAAASGTPRERRPHRQDGPARRIRAKVGCALCRAKEGRAFFLRELRHGAASMGGSRGEGRRFRRKDPWVRAQKVERTQSLKGSALAPEAFSR